MHTIEDMLAQAVASDISRDDVEVFCAAEGIELSELYNRMSLLIAKRFDANTMHYDDADSAMNAIYGMMIEDAVTFGEGFVLPEPAFSIYIAFDAGEYDHGDGEDPVEKYTKPRIAEIVKDA